MRGLSPTAALPKTKPHVPLLPSPKPNPTFLLFISNLKNTSFLTSSTSLPNPNLSFPKQKEEIRRGLVQIDSDMVGFDRVLKSHECVQHRIHRHEPPVSGEPIQLVHVDDFLVAVNKPASIPVHPTGRYRHNTVLFILAREHGLQNLYPVHRLDKLTSGLLLFARNPQRAEAIASQIRTNHAVQKTYLARVVGEFPETKVVCAEPILIAIDIGSRELNKVHPDGKPSETHFKRLFFDGTHSVVKCKPKTGRTHQIRVHLQHLGFPIVNDPLYNAEYRKNHAEPWEIAMGGDGDDGGDGGDGMDGKDGMEEQNPKQARAVPTIGNDDQGQVTATPQKTFPTPSNDPSLDASLSPTAASSNAPQQQQPHYSHFHTIHHSHQTPPPPHPPSSSSSSSSAEVYVPNHPKVCIYNVDPQPLCHLCPVVWRRPKPHQLCIFLHALSYRGDTFDFETETPSWALPSFSPSEYEKSIAKEHTDVTSSTTMGYTWNHSIKAFEDAHIANHPSAGVESSPAATAHS